MSGAATTTDLNPNPNPPSPGQNDDVILVDNPIHPTTVANRGPDRRGGGPENSDVRYRGVRQRQWGRWVSEIRVPHKRARRWLGTYDTAVQAANAYDRAAVEMYGADAQLNLETSAAYLYEARVETRVETTRAETSRTGRRRLASPRPRPRNLRRIIPRPPRVRPTFTPPPPPPRPILPSWGLLQFGLYHNVQPPSYAPQFEFASLRAMAEYQNNMIDPTVNQPITETTSLSYQNPSDDNSINNNYIYNNNNYYYDDGRYPPLEENNLDFHLQPGVCDEEMSSLVVQAGESEPPPPVMEVEDNFDPQAADYNGYCPPSTWLFRSEDEYPSPLRLWDYGDPFLENTL